MRNTSINTLPINYSFSDKEGLLPEEIIKLRESVGWPGDSQERWVSVLKNTLDVITVRNDTNELVGMACLAGNVRHAVICDLAVSPDHQHNGIGRSIMAKLEDSIQKNQIKYVYAELSEDNPFRGEMSLLGYENTGNSLFRTV